VPPVFEHLTQLHMEALDGVGRIDHFSNLRRIRKEEPI
jgi:hypothetical protein